MEAGCRNTLPDGLKVDADKREDVLVEGGAEVVVAEAGPAEEDGAPN